MTAHISWLNGLPLGLGFLLSFLYHHLIPICHLHKGTDLLGGIISVILPWWILFHWILIHICFTKMLELLFSNKNFRWIQNGNILYKFIDFILSNLELKMWSFVLCVNWSVPWWRKRSSLFFNLKSIQDFFKLNLSMFCVKLVNICMRDYDVTW